MGEKTRLINRELFGESVKDGLENLYDPGVLQTCQLAKLLGVRDGPGATVSQQLRKLLLAALETLRPLENIAYHRPEWLGYRLMQLRYVDGLRQAEVCRELGLGHTSYYTHLRPALTAVASALWCQLPLESDSPSGARGGSAVDQARSEAAQTARAAQRQLIDPCPLWQEALVMLGPLAEQRGIELELEECSGPSVLADRAVLYQVLVDVLMEALKRMRPGALRICSDATDRLAGWRMKGIGADILRDLDLTTRFAATLGVLDVYGGSLEHSLEGGEESLRIRVPIAHPRMLLIIDDNSDALNLYQRYLHDSGMADQIVVHTARSGAEAFAILACARPDLILLDVILPQQDGWNILQRLKSNPDTAGIPVVICSVLSHPDLALMMGAASVLQKPIDPSQLLLTVQSLVRL